MDAGPLDDLEMEWERIAEAERAQDYGSDTAGSKNLVGMQSGQNFRHLISSFKRHSPKWAMSQHFSSQTKALPSGLYHRVHGFPVTDFDICILAALLH
ncbi:hypothetical protein BSKO_13890 [Bryopsis sp. KO-2023]|nr:hypothetical protein BSKO_02604 [Bryopsis sp. KO-2023]GMH44005.1 hypothetical protein BSKO_11939 [Bryopsis sp. KO-2023]GMH45926.1 hypothetical protein BSKO_13890 [Bryopsis sp. KO-2023]